MKIIQVIPLFGFGGAEIMCENLTYTLRDLGHEVIVVSLYDYNSPITERLAENKVDIRYMHKKKGLDVSLFGKLKKLFVEENPDVVHTHLYAAKYAFIAAKKAKIKCVVHTLHSIATKESPWLSRYINSIFFKRDYAVPVALSKLVQDTIIDEYNLFAEKVPIIFNGVDVSKCEKKTDYSVNNTFKILHIGRFVNVKNHVGLIEAFEKFHAKYPKSELQLVGDGELYGEIQSLVYKKRLENVVHFFGQQSNVFGFLHNADVFVLPSLYEGVPMTLIEAMGTGLPIVATAVGGVPDMLDADCSQLVDVDVEQIEKAFENYYLDEQLRQTHGNRVYERKDSFSAKKMAQDYCRLYRKVIEKR